MPARLYADIHTIRFNSFIKKLSEPPLSNDTNVATREDSHIMIGKLRLLAPALDDSLLEHLSKLRMCDADKCLSTLTSRLTTQTRYAILCNDIVHVVATRGDGCALG